MANEVSPPAAESCDIYDQFVAAFLEIPTRPQQWDRITGLFARMSSRQRDLVADFLIGWLTPEMLQRLGVSGEVPNPWGAVFRAAFGGTTMPAAAGADGTMTSARVALDVAVFNRLLAIWHKMWDDAGRYEPDPL